MVRAIGWIVLTDGDSVAAARPFAQNKNRAARGTSSGAEGDESSGSDGEDLPTLQALFAMSRKTIVIDRQDRVRQAASSAYQKQTGNGSVDSDRAPEHEDIGAVSGPGAASAPSPATTLPANIEAAVDDTASGDDCARSPTTELSDSLYAAYMPSCDGDGLASVQPSTPRPHSVADVSGPVEAEKQLTAPAAGGGGDDAVVPASEAALQAKVGGRHRKAVYGPIHCKYCHPAATPCSC